jgi:hypothetical protein
MYQSVSEVSQVVKSEMNNKIIKKQISKENKDLNYVSMTYEEKVQKAIDSGFRFNKKLV